MVPLFAAATAVDTVSKISSGWSHKSSTGSTGTQDSKSPTSFASLLKNNGVDVSKYLQKSTSTLTAGEAFSSSTNSGSSVNQIA